MTRKLPVLVEHALVNARIARAQAVLDIDQKVRQSSVSCTKNCSHCCYHPVLISLLEGIDVYRFLSNAGLWGSDLKARFEKVEEATWGISLNVWVLSEIACPLLVDNQCSAYAGRPAACRVTYSIGDPYDCHPHQLMRASGIIPKREFHTAVAKAETALAKSVGLVDIRLPLAAAVLFGEKLDKGLITVEDLHDAIVKKNLAQLEGE